MGHGSSFLMFLSLMEPVKRSFCMAQVRKKMRNRYGKVKFK
ncbi:hypothetical protein FUAX_37560 [Fulvitalea axinellae]|uniref:Uncharacterized protein n=1 Tax=Fulvitalea axinellae TaxID=1182444 RepID=A0AAU9CGL4_9BACT|nr:hypothetical protein FUAX_37560 [Fulvitalea axinellae]